MRTWERSSIAFALRSQLRRHLLIRLEHFLVGVPLVRRSPLVALHVILELLLLFADCLRLRDYRVSPVSLTSAVMLRQQRASTVTRPVNSLLLSGD